MIVQRGYVAVRKDAYDGRQWYDMATWMGTVALALAKARYQDRSHAGLKAASPVVRIAQVEVRPLEQGVDIGPDYRVAEKKE